MKISLCEFDNTCYRERPVRDPLPAELGALALPLNQSRLVFVTGAGISVPVPTSLPSGPQLADALVAWLRGIGMDLVADALVDPKDLGEVCEAVQSAANRDTLVAQIRIAYPWRGARFNLCHFVLAYFASDGQLDRSFTFNWDPQVQQASLMIEGSKLVTPCNVATLASATSPMFMHLHGLIDQPDTLVFSQTDIDKPESLKWAEPQLRAAIMSSEVALLGFGVEPKYLVESLEEMKSVMGKAPAAIVTTQNVSEFETKSPQLAEICELRTGGRLIQADACEVLGELLRARHKGLADEVIAGGGVRASTALGSAHALTPGAQTTVDALVLGRSLRALIRLVWQAAAIGSEDPADIGVPLLSRFTDAWAEIVAMLLVLMSCADVSTIEGNEDALRLRTTSETVVDMWPLVPIRTQDATRSCSLATENSHLFSNPGDSAVPLVILAAGAWGQPLLGHASLIGSADLSNIVSPRRQPVDALNFQSLQARIQAIPAGYGLELARIVRLEVQNGE